MADIAVRFKKNAMIRIFTDLHIPQKYAAEICEQYDNLPTNALDVYTSLAEVLPAMKGKVSPSALLSYEESYYIKQFTENSDEAELRRYRERITQALFI